MPRTYVALDTETTGLDPEHDRVTEVAAVRFDEFGAISEEYRSFVDPGREIPPFIEELTGVTNAMVRGAPALTDVAAEITRFIGNDVVVAHNPRFDLAHLRRGGAPLDVKAVDTAELSRLLFPARQPRGLLDVAAALGIEAAEHHRALPDAKTAAAIFAALVAHARRLDPAIRLQFARLLNLHDRTLAEVIAGEGWEDVPAAERAMPGIRPAPATPALQKAEQRAPVYAEEVDAVFAAAEEAIAGFEHREEQRRMAEAVRGAFSGGGHWLIEAGTGVGKSLAYLAPAALHALRNGERVVVSTNTINLQEQLYTKDIPALRAMLVAAGAIADPSELRVAILKGRSNYLCLRRWTANYAAHFGDPDFARLAAAMLLWLPETETGDRAELGVDARDYATWQRFSAQEADCLQRQNSYVRDGHCFLQRARKAAEAAHIVIVNHALLLADVSAGGGAIPAYQHLVVDEAHNLEDAATQQFGGAVSLRRLVESLEGLYRPRGRDAREGGAVTLLKQFPPGGVQMAGEALQAAVMAAADRAEPCFVALSRLIPGTNEDDRLLADRSLRTQPAWEEPERLWDSLDHALKEVAAKASLALSALSAGTSTEGPDVVAEEVETAARRVEEMRLTLSSLMSATGEDTISWLARERDGTASINAAPLDVGPTLWDELFSHKETVIATSATLSAAGSMTHTARRLGLEGPESLVLGSPFDYERSTLLCAFEDLPDPATPGYDEASAASLAALVAAADGRTLALFTSHGALRRAAERVRPMLAEQGITVLAQGVDGQPRQLADHLRRQPRSVVLGTSSFWEGVDIKGDALSLLVIARLPFAVPTDPIHRARSAQYDDPFREYSLPSAILKFRQGFGRLIRDRADRGVVAVLDRRIYDKNYGQQFVSALPRCRTLKADTDAISRRVREWLR